MDSVVLKVAARFSAKHQDRDLSRPEELVYTRIGSDWTQVSNFPGVFVILRKLKEKGLIEYKSEKKPEDFVIMARRRQ